MQERRNWMIAMSLALLSAGAVAKPPTASLLENARLRPTIGETPSLLTDVDESFLGLSRLSMDVGMTRVGETSRALQTGEYFDELTGDADFDTQPVFVDGIEGPVRMYEAEFAWNAAEAGPFSLSVLGGVRAYGLSSAWSGVPGAVVSIDDSASDEIVPVPVFGGQMNVALAEGWSLRGRAHGRALDSDLPYLDIGAETEFAITPQVDFIAGYKYLDASVIGSDRSARLRSDGVYARVRWRF